MDQPIIDIQNMGKRYRLGGQTRLDQTLPEMISEKFRNIFRTKPTSANKAKADASIFWALKNINIQIQKGEVVGIIGHNGAGKSTLLKILSEITEPTEGHVTLRGRVGSLLEVGTGFHPELTGRENIYLNGAILGMPKSLIKSKFDDIVEFSGVEKFLDTPVKRYSSGMTVRLAFAVAAHLDPEILIVDEVLAVGDAAFQKKCLGKMKDVANKHGRTVLFVSHNMSAIRHLCQRCIVLNAGEMIFDGPVNEALETYRTQIHGIDSDSEILKTDWKKSDHVHIHDIRFIASKGIQTGRPLTIEVDLEAIKTLVRPAITIDFRTTDDIRVFRASSQFTPLFDAQIMVGHFTARLKIDALPLTSGEYLLNLYINYPKVETLIDLPYAAKLNIEPFDFYGSGLPIKQKDGDGLVVAPHRWTLHQVSSIKDIAS